MTIQQKINELKEICIREGYPITVSVNYAGDCIWIAYYDFDEELVLIKGKGAPMVSKLGDKPLKRKQVKFPYGDASKIEKIYDAVKGQYES